MLADNLKRRGTVLPLAPRKTVGWAEGLDLARGGSTVLYTGLIYQLMPAIAALESMLLRFEDSWLNRFAGLGRAVNRKLDVSGFLGRESKRERAAADRRLSNIVKLLRETDLEFGYLYEEELYSGALVHDEGLDATFAEHAKRVAGVFSEKGVESVITVDPHTTNILRSVFPSVVPGFNLEVRSYLEILAADPPKPVRSLDLDVVIHDSCVYARGENIVEEPRVLLERAGVRVREPESTGRRTLCCGGPAESLFPSRARSICAKRLDELSAVGETVVAMCPICLLNLERGVGDRGIEVMDLGEVLVRAFVAND
jgi:Fe-S oxidoreductase